MDERLGRRISVVGISGSGKTTLARKLGATLGLPVLELDAVNHQPGWVPLPTHELEQRVRAFTSGDGWIVDGNYSSVRESLVWPRADTVVWVDPPRRVVMRQVIARSLRRLITREELWNGNREQWRFLVAWNPERSVIRWAWTRYHRRRAEALEAMGDPRWEHITFVRVSSRVDGDALVAAARR